MSVCLLRASAPRRTFISGASRRHPWVTLGVDLSLSAPPRLGPPRPSGCMRARHGAGAYHSRPRPGLPGSRRRAHPAGPVPGDNQTSKGRRPHGAVSPRHELAGSRRSAPIGSADQGFALERGCARGGRGWRFRIRHAPCPLPGDQPGRRPQANPPGRPSPPTRRQGGTTAASRRVCR